MELVAVAVVACARPVEKMATTGVETVRILADLVHLAAWVSAGPANSFNLDVRGTANGTNPPLGYFQALMAA